MVFRKEKLAKPILQSFKIPLLFLSAISLSSLSTALSPAWAQLDRDEGNVAIVEYNGNNYDDIIPGGDFNFGPREWVANRFYETHGDFYDFLPYGDGRVAIAVGDVSGKGPAAALLAALGVGILREHAVHHFAQPHEMLADLNGHLQILGGNGRFIAMAFSVYDSASRELRIASAGFPQPILVRKNQATPVAVTGVPLGLLSESVYDSVSLRLEPGDAVVFCSDGIHEQTNAREEQFGVERLVSWFAQADRCSSAEKIASDVVHAIDVHAGAGAAAREFYDDRTIVVLRVEDE